MPIPKLRPRHRRGVVFRTVGVYASLLVLQKVLSVAKQKNRELEIAPAALTPGALHESVMVLSALEIAPMVAPPFPDVHCAPDVLPAVRRSDQVHAGPSVVAGLWTCHYLSAFAKPLNSANTCSTVAGGSSFTPH